MTMPIRLSRLLRAAPLLIATALGSCGPERNTFAPACPVPGLVKPLAELTRYRPGSQDIRDLIVRARIANIVGKCKPGDNKGEVLTSVQVVIDVSRGPALQGQTYDLPVFVAVTDSETIRDKTLFMVPVEFVRNVDNARVTSNELELVFPVSTQKSGAAYGIIAGFQLTPEEIAAYRRNTRR